MTVYEFLQDPSSTTGYFQSISKNYKLEILYHGYEGDYFKRIIVVYLDNDPVILGVSKTLTSNPTFLDILTNTGTIPIGTRLFKVGAGINRDNMDVIYIHTDTIIEEAVNKFLNKVDDKEDTLYLRKSDFVYQDETMHLDEYVLPGLVQKLQATPSPLFAISSIDGRYSSKIDYLKLITSEFGLTKFRVKVEIEWFKLLFNQQCMGLPHLNNTEITILDNIASKFNLNACVKVKKLEKVTNHDVKAVEYYIKEQIRENPTLNQYRELVHFALTSEDVNNLSYGLMLKEVRNDVLIKQLKSTIQKLESLADSYRNTSMLSRTHGQAATPTTMGKEMYNFAYRLKRQISQLQNQEILGKLNGAVGNYNSHLVADPNVNWPAVSKELIENQLGLTFNPYTTQIEPHDFLAEFFDNLRRINVILLDLTRDIWGYISIGYFSQKHVDSEVGSSTMPHKINPIDFENSEGNLGLANALITHMSQKLPISRYQRDLSDSTVLRNIGSVIAYSMIAYNSLLKGLTKLDINYDAIKKDLVNNWEVVTEAVQTIMRKSKISDAYEQLKQLTRGKQLERAKLQEFIKALDISTQDKEVLLQLSPSQYIGLANKLY